MKKYFVFFKNEFANTVVYRGPVLVWVFSNIISLVVITAVWRSASGGQSIGGYERPELVSYYVVSFFLHWIINWLPIYSTGEEIKNGEILGSSLVKPFSFYWRKFSEEAGWHSFATVLGLFLTLSLLLFFKGQIVLHFSLPVILLTALATILTTLVIFEFSLCLGLLAFWLTDIWAVDSLFWAGKSFLGGAILPLSFFPVVWQPLIRLLPFRYTLSFPLEVYFGKLSAVETAEGVMIALFWILLFALLYKFLWERGRRAYTSFGH